MQVMAWCHQATSHYTNHYGWINQITINKYPFWATFCTCNTSVNIFVMRKVLVDNKVLPKRVLIKALIVCVGLDTGYGSIGEKPNVAGSQNSEEYAHCVIYPINHTSVSHDAIYHELVYRDLTRYEIRKLLIGTSDRRIITDMARHNYAQTFYHLLCICVCLCRY